MKKTLSFLIFLLVVLVLPAGACVDAPFEETILWGSIRSEILPVQERVSSTNTPQFYVPRDVLISYRLDPWCDALSLLPPVSHETKWPHNPLLFPRTLLFTPEDRDALYIGPPRMGPGDFVIQWASLSYDGSGAVRNALNHRFYW